MIPQLPVRCYLYRAEVAPRVGGSDAAREAHQAIDTLPVPPKDIVYWDVNCPGFGVKVTPTGRKVFVVLYRTVGTGSRLRKYTIGTYGRVTLSQARVTAQ